MGVDPFKLLGVVRSVCFFQHMILGCIQSLAKMTSVYFGMFAVNEKYRPLTAVILPVASHLLP